MDDTIDIKKFDDLDKFTSTEVPADLKEISDLDQWMKSLPLQKVGVDFTATVVASAMLAQKRNASFKFFVWTIACFGLLIGASYWLLLGQEVTIELSYWSESISLFSASVRMTQDIFTSPKTQQLFIIIEGVLCLIVLEKIVSSYKTIKNQAKRVV